MYRVEEQGANARKEVLIPTQIRSQNIKNKVLYEKEGHIYEENYLFLIMHIVIYKHVCYLCVCLFSTKSYYIF